MMESRLNCLSDDKLLEKHFLSTCEFFCRMSSSQLKPSVSRQLCWLALARLVRKCNPDMLKRIFSRLQKRIVDLGKQEITVSAIHFVCAILTSLPTMKRFNAEAFASLIGRIVDYGVVSKDEETALIAAHAFALYANDSSEDVLLSSLRSCLSGAVESDETYATRVRFTTCQMRNNRDDFISMIFNISAEVLDRHLVGFVISPAEWLEVARCALRLNVRVVSDSIFRWLEKLILHAGMGLGPFEKQIMSLFVDFSQSSNAFFDAFRCFYVVIGLSEGEVSALNLLLDAVEEPWHSKAYALSFVKAVSVVLLSRSYLLKPQGVFLLQQKTCKEILRLPGNPAILHLFTALLCVDHELVPSPVQLAQSLFSTLNDNPEVYEQIEIIRSLCACISRPKLHLVPHFEKWTRKMKDLTLGFQNDINQSSSALNHVAHLTSPEGNDLRDSVLAEAEVYLVKAATLSEEQETARTNENVLPMVVPEESKSGNKVPSNSNEEKLSTSYSEQCDQAGTPILQTEAKLVLQSFAMETDYLKSSSTELDVILLEKQAEETSPKKRKLVDVWSDEKNWDVTESSKSANTTETLHSNATGFLTTKQMMEDLCID